MHSTLQEVLSGSASAMHEANREPRSIQIEQGDNLPHVLRFLTRLHEQPTVVKSKTDHLLHLGDDVHVTQPAVMNRSRLSKTGERFVSFRSSMRKMYRVYDCYLSRLPILSYQFL